MRGLEDPGPRPKATPCGCVKPTLETGNLLTEPIGYLESCFLAKNGTPRQPTICSHSRACLRIRKSIFNNPEHSLMGLEQFSHVWILFVFHKNGHLSCKAKVQPPRLNGAKTGVFSTRSPHRPNAIGLTLAKLEKVEVTGVIQVILKKRGLYTRSEHHGATLHSVCHSGNHH
uniref:tRNA methyltransferase O n=1 Tax=Sus scrofa TaxID=9823 RepID=F1SSG8_PIG